jgi:hypothetical protein
MSHYNFMDENPENYPQKGKFLETAEQRIERERGQSLAHYFNGGGGDLQYIDYYAWEKGHNARHSAEVEQTRNMLGREAKWRLEFLGYEVERTRERS